MSDEREAMPEWDHVVAYMHARGEFTDLISNAHCNEIYVLADGFGPLGVQIWEIVPEWDWSHIRDSTPDAVKAMSDRLKELGYMPEGPVAQPMSR